MLAPTVDSWLPRSCRTRCLSQSTLTQAAGRQGRGAEGGEHQTARLRRVRDGRHGFEKMAVNEKGIFRQEARGLKFEVPLCEVRLPLKVGGKWEYKVAGPITSLRLAGTASAVSFDEVVVPAGRYKAWRIEMNLSNADDKQSSRTAWFAPGVGLIKSKINDRERTLKSFTLGTD
jgi:hypothetical protein